MAIAVKLEAFEGPLDLLLHLIEKNKVDIYDIPIVEITRQYMAYIEQMQVEDMNVVSEFLVMAATLLDIKCKMLLPPEVNEEGEEEDPRAELVQKLLEYKMYKYMSYELKDMHLGAQRYLYKKPTIPGEVLAFQHPIDYEELLGDSTLGVLHEIFETIMKRQEDKIDPVRSTFGKIQKEEINLDVKQAYVCDYIATKKRCSFRELLEKQGSKMEIIVTFLILLEMIKVGSVDVEQEDVFGDINIVYKAPMTASIDLSEKQE